MQIMFLLLFAAGAAVAALGRKQVPLLLIGIALAAVGAYGVLVSFF